jgi:hypothetical protein
VSFVKDEKDNVTYNGNEEFVLPVWNFQPQKIRNFFTGRVKFFKKR